jgi:2-C-methyl-D-erythritol 4-phosphate cytidylyltransferase
MNLKNLFQKKTAEPKCSAVILAAGSSQRMGRDKILGALGGLPVIVHTLLVFERSELVDEIVVVTQMEKLTQLADLCKKYNIGKVSKVICGGSTRTESALAGVSEVKRNARLIAIHDGARPLVTESLIRRTVYAANDQLAAVPAVKSTDTLTIVDDTGCIVGSVERERTVRIQTPQVFDAELIKGALTHAVEKGISLTDDASAMEKMGVKVYTVEGEEDNLKLTTPRDMVLAEAILRNRGDTLADRPWL